MKNIVFFGHSSNYSGAEITLYEILKELKINFDHRLHLVLPSFEGDMYDQYKNLGINCLEIPFPWTKTPKNFWNYIRYPNNKISIFKYRRKFTMHFIAQIKDLQPKLIFSNTSVFPWGSLAATNLGVPHIWSIREDISDDNTFINLDYAHTGVKQIYETSKLVYLPSNLILNKLKLSPEYFQKSKILYTTPSFHSTGVAMKSEFLQSPILKILWLGSYDRNKNPFALLKAAKYLKDKKVNFLISFFGAGELGSKMKSFVYENRLEDYVNVGTHNQNLVNIFKLHNVCVSTAKSEAFGRTLAEASYFGLIPIFPENSSWEERFTPNLDSLSFNLEKENDLAEKLLSLLDQNLRVKLSDDLVALAERNFDFKSPGSVVLSDIEKLVE
jgi:glycosyltransferase involved in cell wall biosynthesis